jgi:hypothetical protein
MGTQFTARFRSLSTGAAAKPCSWRDTLTVEKLGCLYHVLHVIACFSQIRSREDLRNPGRRFRPSITLMLNYMYSLGTRIQYATPSDLPNLRLPTSDFTIQTTIELSGELHEMSSSSPGVLRLSYCV